MKFISSIAFVVLLLVSFSNAHVTIPLRRKYNPTEASVFHLPEIKKVYSQGNGSIVIHDFHGVQFYGTVSVGTPLVDFNVIFDTSVANLWLPSKACGAQCKKKHLYDGSASSTYLPDGTPFSMPYGNGSINGYVSWDDFILGGALVIGQPFGEITDVSAFEPLYHVGPWDGVFGLAIGSTSVDHFITPILLLFTQHLQITPVFSFFLPESNDETGELYLGGVDSSKYLGKLVDAPITADIYWQSALDYVKIGDNTTVAETSRMIVDTGYSMIAAPRKCVHEIGKALNFTYPSDKYFIPCNLLPNLPSITISIGNKGFVFEPKDYLINKGNICMVGIVGMDLSPNVTPTWILGDLFVKKVYTVFSLNEGKMQFAYANHNNSKK